MSAGFAIIIMPNAHRQIAQVSEWWRRNRLDARTTLDHELDRALLRLADNPYLGRRSSWRPEVRRLLIRRIEYVVFYRVRPKGQRVEVLAFWHARRGSTPAP